MELKVAHRFSSCVTLGVPCAASSYAGSLGVPRFKLEWPTADLLAASTPVRRALAPVLEEKKSVAVPVDQWLVQSQFHKQSQRQTLEQVLNTARIAMAAYHRQGGGGPRPLIVFDLDDTLFESNQSRTGRILREWLAARADSDVDPAVLQRLGKLADHDLGYSTRDTFHNAKLDLTDGPVRLALQDFDAFWAPRFFSSAYVQGDPVQRGALDYLRDIAKTGVSIAYLTGRDEKRMGPGTRKALEDSGLPKLSSRVRLYLKPSGTLPDAEFKRGISRELRTNTIVLATFDNAPGNVIVFADELPHAMNVFVDTAYERRLYEPRKNLYRISDFSRE